VATRIARLAKFCERYIKVRASKCVVPLILRDDALKTAEQADGAAYIEVITDPYEAPPMYKKLHENV
jgi:hypothetical protein